MKAALIKRGNVIKSGDIILRIIAREKFRNIYVASTIVLYNLLYNIRLYHNIIEFDLPEQTNSY